MNTRAAQPELWANLQINLGNLYRDRVAGEEQENLRQALEFYRGALQVYTRSGHPQDYATAKLNCGATLIKCPDAESAELAIEVFEEAEEVFSRQAYPQYWARLQMGLSMAYRRRRRGDRARNMQRAQSLHGAAMAVLGGPR